MKSLSPAEINTMRESNLIKGASEFWAVCQAVCDEFGVKASAISAPTRGDEATCAAREMVCRLAFDRGFSRPQIGRWIKRDHKTVSEAITRSHDRPGVVFKSRR